MWEKSKSVDRICWQDGPVFEVQKEGKNSGKTIKIKRGLAGELNCLMQSGVLVLARMWTKSSIYEQDI